MADFNDTLRFLQPVSFPGGVTLSTTTGETKAAMVQYASKAFLLASITAGSLTFTNATDIPANAIIHGAYIVTSTQPTFGGTTTGLNAKIGTAADDDGFGQSIAITGTAGIKVPEPGARLGAINTTQNIVVVFTATGGAASLAEVTAGAGTVYIAYSLAPV